MERWLARVVGKFCMELRPPVQHVVLDYGCVVRTDRNRGDGRGSWHGCGLQCLTNGRDFPVPSRPLRRSAVGNEVPRWGCGSHQLAHGHCLRRHRPRQERFCGHAVDEHGLPALMRPSVPRAKLHELIARCRRARWRWKLAPARSRPMSIGSGRCRMTACAAVQGPAASVRSWPDSIVDGPLFNTDLASLDRKAGRRTHCGRSRLVLARSPPARRLRR